MLSTTAQLYSCSYSYAGSLLPEMLLCVIGVSPNIAVSQDDLISTFVRFGQGLCCAADKRLLNNQSFMSCCYLIYASHRRVISVKETTQRNISQACAFVKVHLYRWKHPVVLNGSIQLCSNLFCNNISIVKNLKWSQAI